MRRASPIITRREQPGVSLTTLAELGLRAEDVLDLATGVNPYGPPPRVVEAARDALLTRYPDDSAAPARARIAERLGTSPDCVVLGNGASDLLWTTARVLLGAGASVLSIEPNYAEFSVAARQLGARTVRWRSVERTGHRVDLAQVAQLIELEQPDVVSLSAPGSPTGSSVPFDALEPFAATFPNIHFVIDQSFLSLSDDHADRLRLPATNMLCVRSLGKELGMPGVRVGYLLAHAELAARIEATRPPFSTSAAAQAVACAALDEDAFIADSRMRLAADRARLIALLDQLGLAHTPSVAPFCLVRMARATEVAEDLLVRHRIAVADATPFGLPDHLRISALSEPLVPQLMAALVECIERRHLTNGREA